MNPNNIIQNTFNFVSIQKCKSIITFLNRLIDKIQIEALFAITATILALLIPLAIFMIEINGSSEDGSVLWDKMVIFTQVIHVKLTVIGIILITLPLIFWDYEGAKLLIVILFFAGQFIMGMLLNNCYRWIIVKRTNDGNYRNEKRLKYLNKIKNSNEIYDTWKLIWASEKNRVGINEIVLLKNFFKKWETYENYEDKNKMLSIYAPNMDINYENIEIIEDHIYNEMKIIQSTDKVNTEYEFKLNEMYLKYAEQSIGNSILMYNFPERFDKYLESSNSDITKRFLDKIGIKLIEIFRKKFNENDKLEDFFPKRLKFEENEDNKEKQKIIDELFINWVRKTKVLDEFSEGENGIFTENLLKLMFSNMSPIIFGRLMKFSNFLLTNGIIIDNEEEEENQLKMYSLKKNALFGTGRVTSHIIPIRSDDKTFFELLISDRKNEEDWTYSHILNSDGKLYRILQSEKMVTRKIELIEKILNADQNLEEDSKLNLEALKIELSGLLNYGKERNIMKK